MPAGPATLFVYYRTDPAQLAALRTALRAIFARIRRETGVEGRWMQRLDGSNTCMEVYGPVDVPEAFLALLEAQVREAGIERLLAPGATRRVEVFVPAD